MIRGGTWAWVDRVLMVISIIIGLLTSGAMAWFTSIENAPWPVIILVSSTAFFLAPTGTPTDPPTINLRAVGRRDNWWRLD